MNLRVFYYRDILNLKLEQFKNSIFFQSSLIIAVCLLLVTVFNKQADIYISNLQNLLTEYTSWFYILTVAAYLIIVFFLAVSKYGDIKLGPQHSVPDYSNSSWFSMLFSAGMGLGLLFFGVAEPVKHYLNPPMGSGMTPEAAREAMNITYFHWGLHAWAVYAIVGLVISYSAYRHGRPLLLRSALYPVWGDKVDGKLGNVIDIFAIVCTICGISTSLGYGVTQLNSGLLYLFGLESSIANQAVLMIILMLAASCSLLLGLDKGIKKLSEINLGLAFLLMLTVLLFGPTVFVLETFVQNLGGYFSGLVNKTFNLYAYKQTDWLGGWTLLYWGWWLSWSPFVGMFIARVSRGRTIREFIIGVTLVPALFTFLWMSVFGDTAIYLVMNSNALDLAKAIDSDVTIAMFKFLEFFPFAQVLSGLSICIIIVFLVTSYDSGAMIVDMLSANNNKSQSRAWTKFYWAFVTAMVSIVLLMAGGLSALQTATIASALPFNIILLIAVYGFIKTLHIDRVKMTTVENHLATSNLNSFNKITDWQDRLDKILSLSNMKQAKSVLNDTVKPALQQVADEFRARGFTTILDEYDDRLRLTICHDDEQNFIYGIKLNKVDPLGFIIKNDKTRTDKEVFYRAEVFLREGGLDYDLTSYEIDHIIHDVLNQYEKHVRFLQIIK